MDQIDKNIQYVINYMMKRENQEKILYFLGHDQLKNSLNFLKPKMKKKNKFIQFA